MSDRQFGRMDSYFPPAQGAPRVDDRRVVSGIIFAINSDRRWRDTPC